MKNIQQLHIEDIKNTKDYSSATLSSLKIKGYNIDFNSNLYDYVIDIEENVTELDINYEAVSEYAKVSLTGNSNLNKSEKSNSNNCYQS